MLPLFSPKDSYAKRRLAVAAKILADQDLIVYFSTPLKSRNFDNLYPHRPDSSFYYLSGFAEANSAFLLWKSKGSSSAGRLHYEIFTMPRDPAREQWDGYRYGPKRAATLTGAQVGHSIERLGAEILAWLEQVPKGVAPRIWTNAQDHLEHKTWLDQLLQQFRPRLRSGKLPVASVTDVGPHVQQLRLLKGKDELHHLRAASQINIAGHLKLLHSLKPGMWEYEAQGELEGEYKKRGALETAYPSIVASGPNATILHYNESSRRMKDGDLLLVDAGCEHRFYSSDITRTFPVNGVFSKPQRQIMDVVAEAHAEVIGSVRVGTPYNRLNEVAEEVLLEGLRSLGLVRGTAAQARKSQIIKRYYPHSIGHWLGLDTHDQCPYVDERGRPLKLQENMVLTVEPGLYFRVNDKTVPAEYRGIGVRIEDDMVVRKGKADILTEGLPRYAAEIESEMRRSY